MANSVKSFFKVKEDQPCVMLAINVFIRGNEFIQNNIWCRYIVLKDIYYSQGVEVLKRVEPQKNTDKLIF